MDKRLELAYTKISECLVCFQRNSRTLGIRGNREYTGANPNAFPHLHTQVVECRNCGFIYTDPQIFGVEFLEEEYYNQPDGYQVNSDDALNEMYTERIRFIRKFKTSGELLDIGAGKGYFVRVAKLSGFTAVGIEPSPKFCDFAKKNLNLDLYNGTLETAVDLGGRKFDVITLHHVLEHVEAPHELLERLRDLLHDDGIVYLEVPNTHSLTSKLIDAYFRIRGLSWSGRLSPLHPPFHKYGYNPKSLNYLLREHSYTVIKCTTFSGFSRGFKDQADSNSFVRTMRDIVVRVVDLLGNRDMLAIVARK